MEFVAIVYYLNLLSLRQLAFIYIYVQLFFNCQTKFLL